MPSDGRADRRGHDGGADPGRDSEVRAASASYAHVLQFRTGCQAALWTGIALFSLLIVAAPRFTTLLLHLFNDPFAADKAYVTAAPVYLMVCSLLVVWLLVELLLVVRRLPSDVISLESAAGLARGAGALGGLAVAGLVRVIAYPTLDAAIGTVAAALATVLLLCLAAWVRWQAHASTAKAISSRQQQSHLRPAGR